MPKKTQTIKFKNNQKTHLDECIIDINRRTITFIQHNSKKTPQNPLKWVRSDLGEWDNEFLVKFETKEK